MEVATEERADETTDNEDNDTEAEQKAEAKLLLQIQAEHKLCDDFMRPKRAKWLKRLKLYNNQTRDESKVGDPLLFTVFQTVFAALYVDRLSSLFEANDEGDQDTAENLTDLAQHDYSVMEKDELDYDWDWDACFFGRGLLLLSEFDRTEGVMAPVNQPTLLP